MNLTFTVTCRHRSLDYSIRICHFLLVIIFTEPLSPVVFETLNYKHVGVAILTFRSHVTSPWLWSHVTLSVTWTLRDSFSV